MSYENFPKDMFESIPDYRKIVLLTLLIKYGSDLLNECGFLKNDINRLSLEFKNNSMEQNEENIGQKKMKKNQ